MDDRLCISKLPSEGKAPKTAWLIAAITVCLAGFINRKKSTFGVDKEIEFLGCDLDTKNQTIAVPENKWTKFCDSGKLMLKENSIALKWVEIFRGKACSFMIVAPMMRLFIREMNEWIKQANNSEGVFKHNGVLKKRLTKEVREEIKCWIKKKGITTKRSWLNLDYDVVKIIDKGEHGKGDLRIATDASNYAAGIVIDGFDIPTKFYWKDEQAKLPIHVKEGLAILEALKQTGKKFEGKTILLECDNIAVVKTFKHGAKDPKLSRVIKEIHILALKFNYNLVIEWVPTDLQRADEPSRELCVKENELATNVFTGLNELFDLRLDLDCFATRWNKKCSNFVSWEYDDEAWRMNFFTIKNFENFHLYCYPPEPVLTDTVNHLFKYASENIWCLIFRNFGNFPDCYPMLKEYQNLTFYLVDNDTTENILTPDKKLSDLGYFKKCRLAQNAWVAIHHPNLRQKEKGKLLNYLR